MENIRLIKPFLNYSAVEDDFRAIFESGIFTKGENVNAFAKELATYVGSKHAFLTTSATTALWVCLKALNITQGDEVAVSDFSFPATANVVEDLGAHPIFIDVDKNSFNMKPEDLIKKISSKTKAVIFVDSFGNPSNLLSIRDICKKHSIPLIEDAACAIGSRVNTQCCGQIADLTCFSFHPRKLICTGEGGAITTNNDDLANWLDQKLQHGATQKSKTSIEFSEYGFNFRMSEIQSVMGRKQLHVIDDIIEKRNEIKIKYQSLLETYNLIPQKIDETVRHNVQSLVFRAPSKYIRNKIIFGLRKKGIETTIGTYAQSNTVYYKNKYSDVQQTSSDLENTTITFPCYDGVPYKHICKEIDKIFSGK